MNFHLGGILSIFFGLCSGVYLLRSLIRRRASQNWPTTTGTILESSLDEDSDGYAPHVAYAYAVAGKRYTNDRIYFHTSQSGTKHAAQKHLSAYPMGTRVDVYFNPQNPHDSVLNRHMPIWLPVFWLFFALFLVLVGILLLSDDQVMKNTSEADSQNTAMFSKTLQPPPAPLLQCGGG